MLILNKGKSELSWYSFDKNGQKKTCLETIHVKEASVRRSTQSEERERPPIRSERRSEVREDYSRGGFVVSSLKTGRMTYFCVCSLSEEEALEITKTLKVLISCPTQTTIFSNLLWSCLHSILAVYHFIKSYWL